MTGRASIGRRRLLMFVLVALVSVACGGESVPDDQAVRAEVVPRIEATFEEISLVAGLGESENFCAAQVGMGGTSTLSIDGSAPGGPEGLERVAELWGVSASDDVRMVDGRYRFRARIVGDGILEVTGRPSCPDETEG